MKKAPMGKYKENPKAVAVRKSGSNTTPRPDGVRMSPSGSKEKPKDAWISPKSTVGDKERPVIKEVTRKEPPWRKPGNSTQTPRVAK